MTIELLYEKLAAPAQRALRALNLAELKDLARHERAEIENLHGIGPNALKIIDKEMKAAGLSFSAGNAEGESLVDLYIASAPPASREKLKEIRKIIRDAVPGAVEKIAYRMPAYELNGPLVYFAGYERHIGFYPTPSGLDTFTDEISKFKSSKGAVQFPLDQPLPADLIRKIVAFRIAENEGKKKRG